MRKEKKAHRIKRKGRVRGVAHLIDICLVGPGAKSLTHHDRSTCKGAWFCLRRERHAESLS